MWDILLDKDIPITPFKNNYIVYVFPLLHIDISYLTQVNYTPSKTSGIAIVLFQLVWLIDYFKLVFVSMCSMLIDDNCEAFDDLFDD